MMENHDLSGKKTNEENPEKKSNNKDKALPRAPLELRASLTVRASQQLRASQSLRAPVVLSGWEKVPFGAFIGR